MRDNGRKVLLTMVVVLILAAAGQASGAIYKYVDEKGIECYADSMQAVPERFKKKAVIVQGREASPAQEESLAARTEGAGDRMNDKTSWAGKYLSMFKENKEARTAAFVAVFLLAFIAVGRAGTALGQKQLSSVVRFALAAGLLLYLASAYLKDVASFYADIKEGVTGVRKQADDRNAETKKITNPLLDELKK